MPFPSFPNPMLGGGTGIVFLRHPIPPPLLPNSFVSIKELTVVAPRKNFTSIHREPSGLGRVFFFRFFSLSRPLVVDFPPHKIPLLDKENNGG